MHWSFYLSLSAFAICLLSFLMMFFRGVRRGGPKDLAAKAGSVGAGVFYANTSAMSPFQKESASKHLPTYVAGMIYHVGTLLALVFFIVQAVVLYRASNNSFVAYSFLMYALSHENTLEILRITVQLFWLLSGACGLALLFKRVFSKALRPYSHPDDFVANVLTTVFHFVSVAYLFWIGRPLMLIYFLATALFFLYMPLGKLRHALYYFFARYHLGFFYGRRGVWPPRKKEPMV